MKKRLQVPHLGENFDLDADYDGNIWGDIEEYSLEDNNPENACPLDTSFKIGYTDTHLRVIFKCRYDEILATYTNHDDPLYEEDVVEIFLNPGNDDSRYFEFEASPNGVTFDAQIHNQASSFEDGRNPNMEGDASWDLPGYTAFSRIDDGVFYVEMAIPFEGFEKPNKGDRWKGNVFRINYRGPEKHMELKAFSKTGKADFHITPAFAEIIFG